MNVVVIEHVSMSELPPSWRARMPVAPDARVTVRIEEEVVNSHPNVTPFSRPILTPLGVEECAYPRSA